MHPLISIAGVLSCLVTLVNLTEASASPTSVSSSSQADAMQRIYNETSCNSGLMGGYFPVEDLQSSELKAYSALALGKYMNANFQKFQNCSPDINSAKNSIRVDAACQQVVAGTNYVIAFNVEFPCRAPGMESINDELLANVFVPLPTSENASPQVTSVVAL